MMPLIPPALAEAWCGVCADGGSIPAGTAALCTGVGVKQIVSTRYAFALACIDGKVGAWGRSGCTRPKALAGLEPFAHKNERMH